MKTIATRIYHATKYALGYTLLSLSTIYVTGAIGLAIYNTVMGHGY